MYWLMFVVCPEMCNWPCLRVPCAHNNLMMLQWWQLPYCHEIVTRTKRADCMPKIKLFTWPNLRPINIKLDYRDTLALIAVNTVSAIDQLIIVRMHGLLYIMHRTYHLRSCKFWNNLEFSRPMRDFNKMIDNKLAASWTLRCDLHGVYSLHRTVCNEYELHRAACSKQIVYKLSIRITL